MNFEQGEKSVYSSIYNYSGDEYLPRGVEGGYIYYGDLINLEKVCNTPLQVLSSPLSLPELATVVAGE